MVVASFDAAHHRADAYSALRRPYLAISSAPHDPTIARMLELAYSGPLARATMCKTSSAMNFNVIKQIPHAFQHGRGVRRLGSKR
jgi:hypothetical protein